VQWIKADANAMLLRAEGNNFDNDDLDEAKAEKILKNGLGEIARINGDRGPGNLVYVQKMLHLYNKVQQYFVEKTRLGIPVMVHEEGWRISNYNLRNKTGFVAFYDKDMKWVVGARWYFVR
jgi:hypothetical protein